jgi:hypothetical protein
MSVIPFGHERRRRRSSNTYEAIKFQLEHIFEQQNLLNFVLGDSRGLLLANAGRSDDAHVLAAYAPVVAKCTTKSRYYDIVDKIQTFIPEASPSSVAFRTFVVDGEEMHLCILGEQGRLNHADIYRAVSGVRRILDEERKAA